MFKFSELAGLDGFAEKKKAFRQLQAAYEREARNGEEMVDIDSDLSSFHFENAEGYNCKACMVIDEMAGKQSVEVIENLFQL